jgi:YD repeat-containing protein
MMRSKDHMLLENLYNKILLKENEEEYDDTHVKIRDSDGKITIINDSKGRLVYRKYPGGNEEKIKYDDKGNILYHKHFNGTEEEFEYDDDGWQIYYKNPSGTQYFTDRTTNTDTTIFPDGKRDIKKYNGGDEDKHVNLIYHKDKEGTERFWEYDDTGNKLSSYRDSNGTKHEWKYDDEGNMIYRDDEHGKARYSFDKSGDRHLIESEGKNNDVHSIRYDDEGGFKYFWNRRMIVPKEPKEEPPF